jgi:hypothetical protein
MFMLVLPNQTEIRLPDHCPIVLGRGSTTTGTLPGGCRVYRVDSSGKKAEDLTQQMGPRDVEIVKRLLQPADEDEEVHDMVPVTWSVQK